jgi:hypothetical protein
MTNDIPEGADNEDEIKAKLEGALKKTEAQEAAADPFATDGLGHKPAEEDDSGSAD